MSNKHLITDEMIECVHRYTLKYQHKISEICEPLSRHLGIPYFTYYFIEGDGSFGTLTNHPNFIDYYYSEHMYRNNPYMSHPSLFRSGYVITPCSFEENEQKVLDAKYSGDHLFLMLEKVENKVEGFIFFKESLQLNGIPCYLENLDLLVKFSRFFKREAVSLIGKLRADRFNIQKTRQEAFLQADSSLPLIAKNPKIQNFLKDIYGLSPQEAKCLELFKKGHSAQATGAMMGISNRTIETYFEKIKDKLGCHSKWDLLNY